MTTTRINGPDFICIGMQKAGTGWLFDQLKHHPEFWMPPVKEFAYLLRKKPELQGVVNALKSVAKRGGASKYEGWANRREGDSRDLAFLQEAKANIGVERNIERYISLYRFKEDALSGDISSGYCGLDRSILSDLSERLPLTKVLLLLRDPIDSAWSHVSMWQRAGKFDARVLESKDAFLQVLRDNGNLNRTSSPSKMLASWQRHAPKMNFRHFFFDDIVNEPEKTRGDILQYIGATPEQDSGRLVAGHNKKAKKQKLELTPEIKDVLVDYFRDELTASAALFGSHAHQWMKRYGL